ncbi:GrpB family protein [Actinoplanes sp. NPDC024001]|uniref:GrpB family protein n=1 Tax=Actinoplanes sp. NPDC024001 TaxID=3154598 RepID=UPI0034054422
MAEYPPEITQRFHGTPDQMAAALVGERPASWESIVIEEYDPRWADRFTTAAAALRELLGEAVVSVEHVGSTSVPGLAAKPVIDIDLTLKDNADEAAYVPALATLGYRLILREPWWYGHRMLVSAAEDVNLHVWPPGAPEPVRHLLFRDWLRTHPDDLERYASTKRRLSAETTDRPGDYSLAKNEVIDEIFTRIFSA